MFVLIAARPQKRRLAAGATHMRLTKLTLREIHMPLLTPFQTSFGISHLRRILLVELESGKATGWGECVAGEDPFYSYETVETAWHVLVEHIWPNAREHNFTSAADIYDFLAPIRGHNMAKAAIESAAWDAEAKSRKTPLWRLLDGTREEIPCGVSIGIQPNIETLLVKVEKELAAGYQRIKIKIQPGWDIEPVAALRERWPQIRLMVDANSAYTLRDAAHLKRLDPFYLIMIEQPLGWDDIYEHAELQKQLETPICLDESIHSYHDARSAISLGACRIINIKMGRVGGHTSAKRIHDLCLENRVPVWCGGMLESGIGRAQNIALSTLSNFVLPGDVSASKRYWAEDIISPEVEVTRQGTIKALEAPGIGYEPRLDRIESLTKRKEILK
jgi:o-succinylbenzoate synthase